MYRAPRAWLAAAPAKCSVWLDAPLSSARNQQPQHAPSASAVRLIGLLGQIAEVPAPEFARQLTLPNSRSGTIAIGRCAQTAILSFLSQLRNQMPASALLGLPRSPHQCCSSDCVGGSESCCSRCCPADLAQAPEAVAAPADRARAPDHFQAADGEHVLSESEI